MGFGPCPKLAGQSDNAIAGSGLSFTNNLAVFSDLNSQVTPCCFLLNHSRNNPGIAFYWDDHIAGAFNCAGAALAPYWPSQCVLFVMDTEY